MEPSRRYALTLQPSGHPRASEKDYLPGRRGERRRGPQTTGIAGILQLRRGEEVDAGAELALCRAQNHRLTGQRRGRTESREGDYSSNSEQAPRRSASWSYRTSKKRATYPIRIAQGGTKDQLVNLAKSAPLAKDWQAPVNPPRLRVLTLKEIAALPPVTWLVNGLIPKQALAMVYGEPGGGKTFTALDIALTVAHGAQWHGHEVAQGQVFYVAGEGVGGFRKRIGAWHQHHEFEEEAPFYLIPRAVNLLDDTEIPGSTANHRDDAHPGYARGHGGI